VFPRPVAEHPGSAHVIILLVMWVEEARQADFPARTPPTRRKSWVTAIEYDVAAAYYTDLPLRGIPTVPLVGGCARCASGDIDTYVMGAVVHGELVTVDTTVTIILTTNRSTTQMLGAEEPIVVTDGQGTPPVW
jgi:hypothetical protein